MLPEHIDNSVFMRTVRRLPTSRRPIWLMRQAGRYLPEYRQTRAEAGSFLNLVKNPELACRVTLQPIERFGFDASIIFSDILIIPDAMQLGLEFVEGEGPHLTQPIANESDANKLVIPTNDAFRYLFDAIHMTRQSLPNNVPLIGFCGSPFTLACYMIDGAGGAFWKTRAMRYHHPHLLHDILRKVTRVAANLLIEQARSGCQAVMIFDSWGGILTDEDYMHFSLPYITEIVNCVKAVTNTPVIVFSRQCTQSLPHIATCGCDVVGIDWQTSATTAKRLTKNAITLQGNMDPAILLSTPQTVISQTHQTLQAFDTSHHILNLGHGIDKRTPLENVTAMVETVKKEKDRLPNNKS